MRVVKIGGSLQNSDKLSRLLDYLLEEGNGKTVLVPGGGSFANTVRKFQADTGITDEYAHRMALLAMEQFACYLTALAPGLQTVDSLDSIHDCLAENGIALWLPCKMVCSASSLPASWDITSDSLAAWLALELGADSLTLVKSVRLPQSYSGWHDLAGLGLVDAYIEYLLRQEDLSVYWLHRDDYLSIFSPSAKTLVLQQ